MKSRFSTIALLIACCAAACVQGRVLLQPTDFDLILGVQPAGNFDYGGRHITIAKIKSTSREAAKELLKKCSIEWVMKGPPANCLGHMDAGANACKDNLPWGLHKDGYGKTPVISIASKTIDAYAECLHALKDPSIELKGPKYSKNNTVWHCALYNTADALAELNGFVDSKARWVPFLNGRHIGGPGCPPPHPEPKGRARPCPQPLLALDACCLGVEAQQQVVCW